MKGTTTSPTTSSPRESGSRPEKHVIEQMYLAVLEETLTPPEVRDRLVETQTIDQKYKFVQAHKALVGSSTAGWGAKEKSMLDVLNNASAPDIAAVLNLKVIISSANRDVMNGFLNDNGVAVLMKLLLQRATKRPLLEVDVAMLYEVLSCFKLVMNNGLGMKGVLETRGSIDTIAICLIFEFKPLALLVLEILAATCFSEESSKIVVDSMMVLAKARDEIPFQCLAQALLEQDVEVRAAILRFVVSAILGADIEAHSIIRRNLTLLRFDLKCDESMQQINDELEILDLVSPRSNRSSPTNTSMSGAMMQRGLSVLKRSNSGSVNVPVVALKGLRDNSVRRAQVDRVQSVALNRQKAMESITSDTHRTGRMMIAVLSASCMASTVVEEPRWHTVDGEYFRRHHGPTADSTVESVIKISTITDVSTSTQDGNLAKIAQKRHLYVLEIVHTEGRLAMACATSEERELWLNALKASRDHLVIAKSSYYMNRTYLEVKDAFKFIDRFRKLYGEYKSFGAEEQRVNVEILGFDPENVDAVFDFLKHETMAAGSSMRLLMVMQELLLIPSVAEDMWEAIAKGIRNLRRIQLRNEGVKLDVAFNDLGIVSLLKRKLEFEGAPYKQMSKLALTAMSSQQELSGLREAVQTLEERLKDAQSMNEQQAVKLEQEVVDLRKINEELAKSKAYDEQEMNKVKEHMKKLEETISTLNREKEELQRQRQQLEQDLLTRGPPGSAPAGGGGSGVAGNAMTPQVDEKFAKFEKMRKMLPEGAVRQKMAMEGIGNAEIDAFFNGTLTALAPPTAAASTEAKAVDPRLEKFEKMRKMLPEGAVRQKMAMEGLTQAEIDAFFSGEVAAPPAAPAEAKAADPRLEKFEKMRKMLPEGAVRQKMAMEGLNQAEIDAFFSGASVPAAPTAAPVQDSKYEKYDKMKKMLPEPAIRHKMKADGLSDQEIDNYFSGGGVVAAAAPAAAAPNPLNAVKYAKYDRMKKAGLPDEAVRQRMVQDGMTTEDIAGFFATPATAGPPASGGATTTAAAVENKKPTIKPSIKLKNLFWNKINPAEIKGTIWTHIPEYTLDAEQMKTIEKLFAAKESKGNTAQKAEVTPAAAQQPKQISVLDGKRTQNVLIFMGKLRKGPEEILQIIWELNPDVLTLEMTTALMSVLPTDEESAAAKQHAATPELLDNATALVLQLSRLPRLSVRLECHEIAFTWFTSAYNTSTQLGVLESSVDEVKACERPMKALLSIIITVGNFINGGTRFGEASGVKLDTLSKIANLKATEAAQGSLMNFIALLAESQSPELVEFSENWVGVWAAAELSLKQILTDLSELKKLLEKIQQELKFLSERKFHYTIDNKPQEVNQLTSNPLCIRCHDFLEGALAKYLKMENMSKRVQQSIESLMSAYGEDFRAQNDEDNSKRFFSMLASFARSFRRAHEENVRRREAEEKAARLALEATQRNQMKNGKAMASAMTGKDDKGRRHATAMPAENIFGLFHSQQEEDSSEIVAKYRKKLMSSRVPNSDKMWSLLGGK